MPMIVSNEFAVKGHSENDVAFSNLFLFITFLCNVFTSEMCILFQMVLYFSPFFTMFTLSPIFNFIIFAFVADLSWA